MPKKKKPASPEWFGPKKHPFAMVSKNMFYDKQLNSTAIHVYGVLVCNSFATDKWGVWEWQCRLGIRHIAMIVDVSEPTIKRAIARLVDRGLIRRIRTQYEDTVTLLCDPRPVYQSDPVPTKKEIELAVKLSKKHNKKKSSLGSSVISTSEITSDLNDRSSVIPTKDHQRSEPGITSDPSETLDSKERNSLRDSSVRGAGAPEKAPHSRGTEQPRPDVDKTSTTSESLETVPLDLPNSQSESNRLDGWETVAQAWSKCMDEMYSAPIPLQAYDAQERAWCAHLYQVYGHEISIRYVTMVIGDWTAIANNRKSWLGGRMPTLHFAKQLEKELIPFAINGTGYTNASHRVSRMKGKKGLDDLTWDDVK